MGLVNFNSKKFGDLTVVKEIESISNKATYLCSCECGERVIKTGIQLIRKEKVLCSHNKQIHNPTDKKKYYRIKSKYGITPEQYNLLKQNQNNKCKICGKDEAMTRNGLVIDHDHKTGKVRGLLCSSCNTGLGRFKDSVNYLEQAIKYLLET